MSINVFSLTYRDVQQRLQGYDLAKQSQYIDSLVKIEAAAVNSLIEGQGIDLDDVVSGTPIYEIARQIIILRVIAEVGRSFTHQNPELSDARDARAKELEKLIRQTPETLAPGFDSSKVRGSFRRKTYEELGISKPSTDGVFD